MGLFGVGWVAAAAPVDSFRVFVSVVRFRTTWIMLRNPYMMDVRFMSWMPLAVCCTANRAAFADLMVMIIVGRLVLAWSCADSMAVLACCALVAAFSAPAWASLSPVTLTLYSMSTRSLIGVPPLGLV